MRKLLLLTAALAALHAQAFTLLSFATVKAPQLVWYTAIGTPSSAQVEGRDFVPRFLPYGQLGLDGGGSFFGFDSFKFDTITCSWDGPGTISGGTDVMRVVLLQKSDAGIVCTCDLPGACNDAASTEHTCSCSGGTKYIGVSTVEPGRNISMGYGLQWTTATNCAANANPTSVVCAIPFRQ